MNAPVLSRARKTGLFAALCCLLGALCLLAGCQKNAAAGQPSVPMAENRYTCDTGTPLRGDFWNITTHRPVFVGGYLQLPDYLTLTTCALDTGAVTRWQAPDCRDRIEAELPAGWTGEWQLLGPYPTADGGMDVLDMRRFEYPDGSVQGWLSRHRFAADGTLLQTEDLPLTEALSRWMGTDTTVYTGSRLYWLQHTDDLAGRQLCALTLADGSLQTHALPQLPEYTQLTQLPDGQLLVLGRRMQEEAWQAVPVWYTLDARTGQTGEITPFVQELAGGGAVRLIAADEDGWLLWNSRGIYRCSPDMQTVHTLCRWSDCGIVPNELLNVAALADGCFAAACLEDGAVLPLVLTPLDPDAAAAVTTVTLGIPEPLDTCLPGLAKAVSRFNRAHADIQVQVIDYSVLNSADNNQAGGWQQLDRDILDGCLPDIVLGSDDIHYFDKGVFQDMYPLLDADPDLSRADFLAGPLTAGEVDGQLLFLLPGYTFSTMVAPAGTVSALSALSANTGTAAGFAAPTEAVRALPALSGDAAAGGTHAAAETASFADTANTAGQPCGWTFEQLLALHRQNPQAVQPIATSDSGSFLLAVLLHNGIDRFVDTAAGRCDFTCETFLQLLALCRAYPQQFGDPPNTRQLVAEGRALAEQMYFFDDMFGMLRVCAYNCGEDFAFIGYPTADGSSSGSLHTNQVLMLSANCPHPEAAWQFIRTLLLPDFQDQLGRQPQYMTVGARTPVLPLRRDSLQQLAEEAMRPQTRRGPLPAYLDRQTVALDDPYWLRAITQQEADRLIAALENARWPDIDYHVMEIINEEADIFFAGGCTAETAAAVIQDRVSTFLAEQQ